MNLAGDFFRRSEVTRIHIFAAGAAGNRILSKNDAISRGLDSGRIEGTGYPAHLPLVVTDVTRSPIGVETSP